MRNALRVLGSILISGGILWLLLRETGQSAQEGLQALWQLSLGVWAVYALAQLLQGWLRAIRYRLLLAGANVQPLPPPGRMFGVTLARNMFVDMLPMRIGELMYWALLNRGDGVPSKDCVSSMTLSIWFDMLALAAVLAGAVAFPMLDTGGRMVMLWGGMVVAAIVVVGWGALLYGPHCAAWTLEHVPVRVQQWQPFSRLRRFPAWMIQWKPVAWLAHFMNNLTDSFHQVRGAGVMGRVTLLSVGIRIIKYAGMGVAFYGVASVLRPVLAELPLWQVLIGLISGEGGAALPIPTFMSLGTYEAAGAGAMSLTGVAGSDAALVLLGTHIVSQIVDYSIGGLALLGLMWGKRRKG